MVNRVCSDGREIFIIWNNCFRHRAQADDVGADAGLVGYMLGEEGAQMCAHAQYVVATAALPSVVFTTECISQENGLKVDHPEKVVYAFPALGSDV